jgi:hypothetical protein
MTKDEALKLALDWLEGGNFVYPTELRTAIKDALAQPEQEPVGSVVRWLDGSLVHGWFSDPPPEGTLLYITPPAPLPVQEPTCPECKAAVLYECVACSSNNYPPKPEQEPT